MSKLAEVQRRRDALQQSVPAAAHAAITGSTPDAFLQVCFKKAQQQFLRATRAAAMHPSTEPEDAAARITAVKESVEFCDSTVHLQAAVRIVQEHVH